MLKLIAIGAYYLSLAVLAMGIAGALDLIDFPPVAGVLVYLMLKEVSELTMAYYMSQLSGEG
jgi:hypothetical protein